MKIGIIGTGNIGMGLAKRWLETGHEVLLGSRDALNGAARAEQIGASSGTYQAAVDFGEVVVLAVPWNVAESTLNGLNGLSGKVLLETTNKFNDPRPQTSTALIASWAVGAKVVKAFNTIFAQIIHMPPGERLARIDVQMVGDDADAKRLVAGLINDAGFKAVDVGKIANAHHLENLAAYVIEMGYGGGGMGPAVSVQIVRAIP